MRLHETNQSLQAENVSLHQQISVLALRQSTSETTAADERASMDSMPSFSTMVKGDAAHATAPAVQMNITVKDSELQQKLATLQKENAFLTDELTVVCSIR